MLKRISKVQKFSKWTFHLLILVATVLVVMLVSVVRFVYGNVTEKPLLFLFPVSPATGLEW